MSIKEQIRFLQQSKDFEYQSEFFFCCKNPITIEYYLNEQFIHLLELCENDNILYFINFTNIDEDENRIFILSEKDNKKYLIYLFDSPFSLSIFSEKTPTNEKEYFQKVVEFLKDIPNEMNLFSNHLDILILNKKLENSLPINKSSPKIKV